MDFNAVRQQVFVKTPVLHQIIEEVGTLPLTTYFSRTLSAPSLVPSERKAELLEVVQRKLTTLFGAAIAHEVCQELAERYAVSTADHHGPLAHPFFFSCHMAQAAALGASRYRSILVFACSGISLNNSSFPRGLLVHNEQLDLVRLPFFSLKHRHQTVYDAPEFPFSEVAVVQKIITQTPHLSVPARERLMALVNELWVPSKNSVPGKYRDQISGANYELWQRLPGQETHRFISLAQEELVAELLVRFHFGRATLLEQVFANKKIRTAFISAFDGKTGAFDSKKRQGTVLVWALVNNERVGLWNVGDELVSADGMHRFALTAEALSQALSEHKLLPSMALTFMVLSFYYGLTCGGGFSQVNYLAELQAAYTTLLEQVSAPTTEIGIGRHVATNRFVADIGYIFLHKKNRATLATPYDLLLYGTSDLTEKLARLTQECTLAEAFDQLVPELYQILYRAACPAAAPSFAYSPLLYV